LHLFWGAARNGFAFGILAACLVDRTTHSGRDGVVVADGGYDGHGLKRMHYIGQVLSFAGAAGMGVERRKAEYDDLAKLATERGVSLEEIRKTVR